VKRALEVLLVAWLVAGCGAVTPTTLPQRLTPTACEKRALMTGQAPDVVSPEAMAESLRWGVLAPETCPDAAGRLSLPSGRGR
jgi:hypothetical protein